MFSGCAYAKDEEDEKGEEEEAGRETRRGGAAPSSESEEIEDETEEEEGGDKEEEERGERIDEPLPCARAGSESDHCGVMRVAAITSASVPSNDCVG